MRRAALALVCLAASVLAQESPPAAEGQGAWETVPDAPVGTTPLQDAASSAGPETAEPPPSPTSRTSPRHSRPLTLDEIEAEGARLVAAHPELARLEPIGTSREGRPLNVLVLTSAETGPHTDKPGLLVVGDRGGASVQGGDAESALEVAWALVEAQDAAARQLLARASVYVAPLLDPDRRAARLASAEGRTQTLEPVPALGRGAASVPLSGSTAFDDDFPCGWLPPALRPGAARAPLSRPETLATARFLAEHPNLALVVGRFPLPGSGPSSDPPLEVPDEDRRVLPDLLELLDLLGRPPGRGHADWRVPSTPSGSLFDYAWFAQGVFAAGWPAEPAVALDEPGSEAFEARLRGRVERVLALARELPGLTLEATPPVRSATGPWRLDLRLANVGGLPTESALSAAKRGDRELSLTVHGARVMAYALREPGEEVFRLRGEEGGSGERLRLGRLAPLGERWVRLVLAAEPGATVEITADGGWVASVTQTLVLP